MAAVEVANLTKRFGSFTALDRVTFRLAPGDALTALGPNGAGKSTLLKVMAGLYAPTSGSVSLLGHTYGREPELLRASVSFLGENYALYDNLSVRDNIRFFADLYDISDPDDKLDSLLKKFNATEFRNRKVGELSRGTKQKVALCRALMSRPKVLLLDEPSAFLDQHSADMLHRELNSLSAQGTAIVYATQRLDELNRVGKKMLLLNSGRVVAEGKISDVLGRLKDIEVEVTLIKALGDKAMSRLRRRWDLEAGSSDVVLVLKVKKLPDISRAIRDISDTGGLITGVAYLKQSVSSMMLS